jgi:hypothetical protein
MTPEARTERPYIALFAKFQLVRMTFVGRDAAREKFSLAFRTGFWQWGDLLGPNRVDIRHQRSFFAMCADFQPEQTTS